MLPIMRTPTGRRIFAIPNTLGLHQLYSYSPPRLHQQHPFSSVTEISPIDTAAEDLKSHEKVVQAVNRRRKQRMKQRGKKPRQTPVVRKRLLFPERIVERNQEECIALYESLCKEFPVYKINIVTQKIKKIVEESSENDIIPLCSAFVTLLKSTSPNNPVQVKLLEFILSTPRESLVNVKPQSNVQSSDDDPDARNDYYTDAVKILEQARIKAAEQPLLWRADPKRDKEAERGRRFDLQSLKSESKLKKEAEEVYQAMKEAVPQSVLSQTISLLEKYVAKPVDGVPKKKVTLRQLSSKLQRETYRYFHVVGPLLAEYFYMGNIESDLKIRECREHAQKSRLFFAKDCLRLQTAILESINQVESQRMDMEAMTATESENQPPPPRQTAPRRELKKRRLRLSHVNLDAVVMHEPILKKQDATPLVNGHNAPSGLLLGAEKRISECITFVKNLPIDITVSELDALYSRCGSLVDIQIFNLRPDLDPGPLTGLQIAARRKRQAQKSLSRARESARGGGPWRAPQTPVYAKLEFSTPKGADAAASGALRIFGVVFRKHPMTTIRASDLSQLYIEGIGGMNCLDLEYSLSQALSPDVFVSLDVDQNKSTVVGSCQVGFGEFDLAHSCMDRLLGFSSSREQLLLERGGDEDQERRPCTVQWLRTPRDAEEW